MNDEVSSTEEVAPRAVQQPVAHRKRLLWIIPVSAVIALVMGLLGALLFTTLHSSSSTITQDRNTLVLQQGEVIADVAKKVSPSVVSIVTQSTAATQSFGTISQQVESAGTGIIISKDGYILTNKHVIPDTAEKVQVVGSDGTEYDDVTVVGRDSANDLAFLKVNGGVTNLIAATFGDSSKVEVGQSVVAIGNALGQYQTSVTSGIISALGRPLTASDDSSTSTEQLENLFQTDAAINPGNSGGPLVNLQGQIIGINTAIAENDQGSGVVVPAQGIGFAIPINDAQGLIKSVLAGQGLKRAYLGVRYVSITPDIATSEKLSVKQGAYVSGGDNQSGVVAGSPADKAGLKDKDIITKIDGQTIDSQHPLSSVLSSYSVGDTVTITYVRSGQTKTTTAKLELFSS